MFCWKCGKELNGPSKWCPHCQADLRRYVLTPVHTSPEPPPKSSGEAPSTPPSAPRPEPSVTRPGRRYEYEYEEEEYSPKKRFIAFILALFLGNFGFHRFYVGKWGTGFLWLFTFGLLCVGTLIDIICIAVGCFFDSDDLPLVK